MRKTKLPIFLTIMISLFASISACSSNSVFYEPVENELTNPAQITVYLYGEVKYPGLYNINENTRLYDLIIKAGGFTKDANLNNLNLARVVNNNEMIIIEKQENKQESPYININVATKEELMTLKGIGEAKASAIITYRNEVGYFQDIRDLLKVKGISESVFNEIKDQITV